MSFFQSTYQSDVYVVFKAIEAEEYRSLVHFYEDNEAVIKGLEFEHYFEMLITYINALFEIGDYSKHLVYSDIAIEISISSNIKFYENIDIYQHLLFNKAVSYYNLMEYDKAVHILRELVKMSHDDEMTLMFLKKCLRKKTPKFIKQSRAIAILIFILTALFIAVEILIIGPIFGEDTATIESVRIGLFISGLVVLVGAEARHLYLVNRDVESLLRFSKKLKNK